MSTIQRLSLLNRLQEILIERFDAKELEELERLGEYSLFEEFQLASYNKQQQRRIKAMKALNVQTCQSVAAG